jgi:hypothetical protein
MAYNSIYQGNQKTGDQNMNETLKVIKSTVEASDFHYWLMEHPEVKNVQGYDIIGGLPKDCTGHLMNAYDMYQERHIFNDWIKSRIS